MSRRTGFNLLALAVVLLILSAFALVLSREPTVPELTKAPYNPVAKTNGGIHQTTDSPSSVVACVTNGSLGFEALLKENGYWLEIHRMGSLAGWGHRLRYPQQSVFVTNGLVVTEPDMLAFDIEEGDARNIIRDAKLADVAWGKVVENLAVGLKVRNATSKRGERIRLEMYLRNEGDRSVRLFACPRNPDDLFQGGLHIADPDGKEILPIKGKKPAGYALCSHHFSESDWPTLQPGQSLGPLNLEILTKAEDAYLRDIWFDCSKRGQYQVKIDYEGPAALHSSNTVAKFAPVWQGKTASGIAVFNRE